MVVTSPSKMTVDEEEIFLPNTTKYLERLRIQHAQQRCVLGAPGGMSGGGSEYDPLPVSPNHFTKVNLRKDDGVEVIRGPRERQRIMSDDDDSSFDIQVLISESSSSGGTEEFGAGGIAILDQKDSSPVSKRQDPDSDSILKWEQWQQDPLLRKNKYSLKESAESGVANSILNKIKLRRQERENDRRLRELAEIDVLSSYEEDLSRGGGSEEENDDDESAGSRILAVFRSISDLSASVREKKEASVREKKETSVREKKETSVREKKEASLREKKEASLREKKEASVREKEEASKSTNKRSKPIDKRLPCGLMSLLLDEDEMKEMQEMGRYISPRMAVASPCGGGFGSDDDEDQMQEIGRYACPKTAVTAAPRDGGNKVDDVAKCEAKNGDGTKDVTEQKVLSCVETNNGNERPSISAAREQVEARDDFSPSCGFCGVGDASTSGGNDDAVKKDTDPSGQQWIATVKKVVKKEAKETKPVLWLDTVSSSDSGVEEDGKVASVIKARCTKFASMMLIEEEEIAALKKYSCW
jgi:hypothetical protein